MQAIAEHYPRACPTIEQLVERAGIKKWTLHRRLRSLRDRGMIARKLIPTGEGRKVYAQRWITLYPTFPQCEDRNADRLALRNQSRRYTTPHRVCALPSCRNSLEGKRANAKTCSNAHRQALRRETKSQLTVTGNRT